MSLASILPRPISRADGTDRQQVEQCNVMTRTYTPHTGGPKKQNIQQYSDPAYPKSSVTAEVGISDLIAVLSAGNRSPTGESFFHTPSTNSVRRFFLLASQAARVGIPK